MKLRTISRLALLLLPLFSSSLLLQGCKTPDTTLSFLGTAENKPDWPYRYRIFPTLNGWCGVIELKSPYATENAWVPWDRMNFVEENDGELTFRALYGLPGKAIPVK